MDMAAAEEEWAEEEVAVAEIAAEKDGTEEVQEETVPTLTRIGEEVDKETVLLHI